MGASRGVSRRFLRRSHPMMPLHSHTCANAASGETRRTRLRTSLRRRGGLSCALDTCANSVQRGGTRHGRARSLGCVQRQCAPPPS
eukprot:5467396-Pleurochrysis_carterae.AAC.1